MRLDKFLKASRLVKRRTLAKEVCDQGRVQINGRPSKAGTAVAVGDTISIRFGNRTLCVRVESLKETTRKSEAGELYTVLEQTKADETNDTGS
ncbi:RNA-binding S4 domain-containing protein [Melghirimyces algeriensis]|uniref:RQC P-site tRNA stabilizing factor n=1 Tax=Melghirimyces algeriensis TaxID=910412 RepID=A0A521EAC8_9BACL|nr:RNA-binding S4 domain-containing protein [Melghirimyces algeriensis]SMO80873.1 Ribosomal 50S subunit-recycling heat shock protein, contains S4 domain [Melghirimyces algeriensis]